MDRVVKSSILFKLLCIFIFLITSCWFSFANATTEQIPLKTVKVGILEAFSTIDSVASKRYRDAFEHALFYAVGENEKHLNSCGYKLEIISQYFNNSDLISAGEAAHTLENNGAWIIFGPAKSDQFIMATKKLNHTPIISSMAQSDKVLNLNPPNFTMSRGQKVFASAVLNSLRKRTVGTPLRFIC